MSGLGEEGGGCAAVAAVQAVPRTTLAPGACSEAQELLASLAQPEPRISQSFQYDEKGSALYEKIVEQKEYYLVEAESALVARHMAEIALPAAAASPAAEALVEQRVVELGAGAGHRTHRLVMAMAGHAARTTYSPTDISPSALEENRRYFDATCGSTAGLRFEPLVGTHEVTTQAAAAAQRGGGGGGGGGGVATTFMFMGSSLGNYFDGEIVGLLRLILGVMGPRDRLLLGVDRCHGPRKPAHIIHTAYNDAAGYTAAFALNALSHANRVAGLDFDESQWRHEAVYDEARCSIVTHVVAREDLELRGGAAGGAAGGLRRSFRAGERIFMAHSLKFDEARIHAFAAEAGMASSRSWLDDMYLLVELRPRLPRVEL